MVGFFGPLWLAESNDRCSEDRSTQHVEGNLRATQRSDRQSTSQTETAGENHTACDPLQRFRHLHTVRVKETLAIGCVRTYYTCSVVYVLVHYNDCEPWHPLRARTSHAVGRISEDPQAQTHAHIHLGDDALS